MNPRPLKSKLLAWLPSAAVLVRQSDSTNTLYLTFDDGPDPEHTPGVLDLLREHDALATFFVIGQQAKQHPELVRRIVAEGHALGSHSWCHQGFGSRSLMRQLGEIRRTDRLLQDFDGRQGHDFRPPSGQLPLSLLLALVRMRTRVAYWSYDSMDYRRLGANWMLALFDRAPLRSGDVLLLHDDADDVRQMLAVALPRWKAQGWRFEALPRVDSRATE